MKERVSIFYGSMLFVILISTTLVITISNNYQQHNKKLESELRFNANFVSTWLNLIYKHSHNVLEGMATDLHNNHLLTVPFSSSVLKEQKELLSIEAEMLVNASNVFAINNECILVNASSDVGADLSSREYCKQIQESTEHDIFTDPFVNLFGKIVVAQGVRVTNKSDQFIGMVGILSSLDFFSSALNSLHISTNSSVSILSSDLMVLATNGSDSLQVGSRPTISKESTKILQGLTDNQEVFFEAMRKHHGFNQMVFAKKVPGYPFILLVSKPKYFWADYAYISIIFFILIISFVIALLMKNTVLLSKLLSQNDHYFKLALHDELTGILNRRGFEKNTKQVLESAKQDPISISAVLFDIDYFKQINDTYGHDKGDEVLRRFTRVCQDHITHSDVFARLGGDEFVMLLPNKNGQEATQSISELLDKIRMIRVETPLGEVNISSSIGISEVRSSKESIAKWLDRADKALYQAKNKGRNCVVLTV